MSSCWEYLCQGPLCHCAKEVAREGSGMGQEWVRNGSGMGQRRAAPTQGMCQALATGKQRINIAIYKRGKRSRKREEEEGGQVQLL
jgi:hypothetical protein